MKENEIGKIVVDAVVKVHSALGPGLLESVYEAVLAKELERRSWSEGACRLSGRLRCLSNTKA
jgi:hypothetical protein